MEFPEVRNPAGRHTRPVNGLQRVTESVGAALQSGIVWHDDHIEAAGLGRAYPRLGAPERGGQRARGVASGLGDRTLQVSEYDVSGTQAWRDVREQVLRATA